MRRFWLPCSCRRLLAAPIVFMPRQARPNRINGARIYSGGRGGGARNCGFVTLEQCRADRRAAWAASASANLFYTGPAERPVKHKRKRHDD